MINSSTECWKKSGKRESYNMNIVKASQKEVEDVVILALKLWPEHIFEEFCVNFSKMIDTENCAIFLAKENHKYIGFAQCQLRFDYVEGTKSSPVGYLEGIYIVEENRNQGLGRQLVLECENWSKTKGCTEFGSDIEMDNRESYKFHIGIGFREENRVICFAKKI